MTDDTTIYTFNVTGGFDVRNDLKPEFTANGSIRGFRLPDGRVILPIIGLEIEIDDGVRYEYVTSEKEMAELGMEGLDYNHLEFEAVEDI